ncbi:M66 family metalloprotease [Providencia stuartii]|uniref:M66 family metalloprotease n=1 Tax=Providencia stuartii TaxID=588 RepID=UPI0034E44B2D
MLALTICICQNRHEVMIPTTQLNKENDTHSSHLLGLNDLNNNPNTLFDFWQSLIDNLVISRLFDTQINNHALIKKMTNEQGVYNKLLSEYKEKLGKVFYYNTNNYPSDIQGDLKGNVFYAQHSIIPAINRIDDDIQPHLVSGRKTLVIFKPHEKIKENEQLNIKVYNEDNEKIYSTYLLPPSKLPKIAGTEQRFTRLTPDDFTIPKSFDFTINASKKIKELTESTNYLNQLMTENDIIRVDIDAENLSINLDSLKKRPNKKLILNLADNIDANIKYRNNSIPLSAQQSFVMISDETGRWFTRDESRLSFHYQQALNIDKYKTPETFDVEFTTNDDINHISKNPKLFQDIIKKNDTIKIATRDYHWAKDFIIPNSKQYANKKILFTSQAYFNSDVTYGDNEVRITTGETKLFISDDEGVWSIYSPDTQSTVNYALPQSFDIKINKNKELQKISKDICYFNEVINNNDNIHIATRNANWARHFTLETHPNFKNKKIYFSSEADYDSHVFYGDQKITIKKGDSQLFVCDEFGFWRTYEGEPLINDDSDEIRYIENGWSVAIPAEYIKPKIRLEFDYHGKQGTLSDIYVGAPTELLLHTIDIGMLTPYRGELAFQKNAELQRQYFQQIPINRLIVSHYAPIHLKEIVLPSGKHLTHRSDDDGGGHNGDMREQISKDLISDGINLANYGVHSSATKENNYLPTAQITIHNSRGIYKNGLQEHGWSGGAGKATLYNTVDNEFSHELGHNYKIGHYFKGFKGGVHATPDKPNSTWGWDADNNFFIPNFEKKKTNKYTVLDARDPNAEKAEPYMQHAMLKDAMSGGELYDKAYNAYTLHTPTTAQAIQHFFENSAIFSKTSSTGYQKWDPNTQTMQEYLPPHAKNISFVDVPIVDNQDVTETTLSALLNKNDHIKIESYNSHYPPNIYLPQADHSNKNKVIEIDCTSQWSIKLHVNGNKQIISHNTKVYYISNGDSWEPSSELTFIQKPVKQGVPVVTLVGFYDPQNQLKSYIYPALEGSYGMVYNNDTIDTTKPYLAVTLRNGEVKQYQLDQHRFISQLMNKFHINIERRLEPVKAELYVKGQRVSSQHIELTDQPLPTTINGIIQS